MPWPAAPRLGFAVLLKFYEIVAFTPMLCS
jgi:hypothetical protein